MNLDLLVGDLRKLAGELLRELRIGNALATLERIERRYQRCMRCELRLGVVDSSCALECTTCRPSWPVEDTRFTRRSSPDQRIIDLHDAALKIVLGEKP